MIGPYQVVYADPPWAYRDEGGRGTADGHYRTTRIDDLCALPVGDLLAERSVLLMWATWPTLPDALRLVDAWGCEYRTCAFDWIKVSEGGDFAVGMGHYTRANTEPCLLAVPRGRRAPRRIDAGVRQPILARPGRHSAKPAQVSDAIVRLYGDVPRIELFARVRVPGWHAWGDETPDPDVRLVDGRWEQVREWEPECDSRPEAAQGVLF